MSSTKYESVSGGTDLPEPYQFDGSGNDKYYLSPQDVSRLATSQDTHKIATDFPIGFAESGYTFPERAYKDEDKEAYQIAFPAGFRDQHLKEPEVNNGDVEIEPLVADKKPKIRKWIIIGLIVLVIVGAVLGGTLGSLLKKGRPIILTSNKTLDLESAVGGYLDPKYYATQSAWNGTGVSITAANTQYDDSVFIFYQD